MFAASWQLTILTFVTFPIITIISKWYGNYMRLLSKLMQKKLADGNSVSEAALSSMATVRSFDAAESELKEFEEYMQKYLNLQRKNAVAFGSFITILDAVPQLVYAVAGKNSGYPPCLSLVLSPCPLTYNTCRFASCNFIIQCFTAVCLFATAT